MTRVCITGGPRTGKTTLTKEDDMSTSFEKHFDTITSAAQEALIGTELMLIQLGARETSDEPIPVFVVPDDSSDNYLICISHQRFAMLSWQPVPATSAHAGESQLIAATNAACMKARVVIHAALRDLAAKVDPTRA